MTILDLRRTHASLYGVKPGPPRRVTVPELTVIALDGVGDPARSPVFADAVEALFSVAWGIRARRKAQEPPIELKVMPLEGQWTLPAGVGFAEDPAVRDQLQWSLQIVQPDDVTEAEVDEVKATVARKKSRLVRVPEIALRRLPGGEAAQILHVGPFAEEPASIARIHELIAAEGGTPVLGHREIYLSDMRRTAPEKLRTILRVDLVPTKHV
jgi:hypothetical protein